MYADVVVEMMENMVFLACSTNFITYFTKSWHYSSAKASNMVTNFTGTSFLLTIIGGFVADSFLTRFTAFVIFCSIELLVTRKHSIESFKIIIYTYINLKLYSYRV